VAASRRPWLVVALALGAVVAIAGVALHLYLAARYRPPAALPAAGAPPGATASTAAGFVGSAPCAACHPREAEAHRGSDHARAMEPATADSVRGDFGGTRLTHGGVASTFFRRDGKFFVATDGPDGKPGEFEITHTFGARPLQQYLIPFPAGRLQALGIAWDTRGKAQGGQRWFHLYPDTTLPASDPLHWTGREQTWNYQCAECHSTDLRKGYDAAQNRYRTEWAEMNVSCEACHGPGGAHAAWAKARPGGAARGGPGSTGLVVRLERPAGQWVVKDPQRGIAEWSGSARSTAQVDACARCHARRRPIVDPYPYGRPLLDTHAPALLAPGLYHADGQIQGEVYEWGSFVQSRMFAAGVTCSDCHEPHGLGLRAAGNAVCAQCHVPSRFDVREHHRHAPGSAGAACVSCHMPARTYMVVDSRRDHSLRVPRPDLAAALGTPDACSGCHRDRTARWAADQVARWYGPSRRPHFGPAIEAGRRGLVEGGKVLTALVGDARQPAIARASALALLGDYPGPETLGAIAAALRDGDALVRAQALAALEMVPATQRAAVGAPGLRDPVRTVRLAAARVLAGAPRERLTGEQQADLDRAVAELIASELVDADRPESHVNLANLYMRLGRAADADAALRAALAIDPRFVPALVNQADLYRATGRDADGELALDRALQAAPDNPEALHALGLLRTRQGRRGEGVELLRRAVAARPESSRFAYVYAVALHDAGEARKAITVLEDAQRRRPASRDVLTALVSYLEERGETRAAARYAERLAALSPGDPGARALADRLSRAPAR
jgi:Tfp pilus assembly protein PilF